AVLFCQPSLPAQRLKEDPVEQFKQALLLEQRNSDDYKKALRGQALELALRFRQKNLTRAANGLRTPAEIARALLLNEWPREEDVIDPEERAEFNSKARVIEQRIRRAMVQRFLRDVQKAFKSGSTPRVAAMATLVGETALRSVELEGDRLSLSG